MAERSLRGMSIGAKSLESDDNVDFAARKDVTYVCPQGHRTILPLAADVEAPVRSLIGRMSMTSPTKTARSRSGPIGTCSWKGGRKKSCLNCSRSA